MSNNNTAMHTLGYEGKSGIFSGKDRIRTKRTKKRRKQEENARNTIF